jgi:putative transposase
LVRALRAHGRPEALYLDNGATYSGDQLRTVCTRLGITLLHAKPYDPEARGKMERFWRTLRAGCLSLLPTTTTAPEVQQRLDTFVQQHYQHVPHASLLGKSPQQVYHHSTHSALPVAEDTLRQALTVQLRRRVRKDTTLSINGKLFELDQGYLAGSIVTVSSCLLDGTPSLLFVEHEGQRFPLHPCDPKGNSHRHRKLSAAAASPKRAPRAHPVPFDPCHPLPSTPHTATPTLSEDCDDDDDDLSDLF